PPDGTMAQLRQLLFGTQMREYDERFEQLLERQSEELGRLRDEQRAHLGKLDTFVRGELDRLAGELRGEREERVTAIHQLGERVELAARDLSRDLGARLDALELALGDEGKCREAQVSAQSAELGEALEDRCRGLELSFKQAVDGLRDSKTNRDELAELFTELASRLHTEPGQPET
ncbi:MAG: hypothetical protein WBM40_18150, partial [Thiohalocapsa sp.]